LRGRGSQGGAEGLACRNRQRNGPNRQNLLRQFPMSEKLSVKETVGLLAFLQAQLRDWSRKTIKQRLEAGCVSVNGVPVTRHDHVLHGGDRIEISAAVPRPARASSLLEILHADRDLIAIHKPAGLLAVGTSAETRQHALALLRHQLSRRSQAVKLWPVHRLDRDTSGVLLFATSREMREAVMARWGDAEKTYLAVVAGYPVPAHGTIDQPLRLNPVDYQVHVGDHPDAKSARTHYQTERTAGGRALLRVQLETGRQHQIRAHLAWLGCPVVGDPRYGVAGGRMGLHAWRLKIVHPGSLSEIAIEAPVPADFWSLLPVARAEKSRQ
jgi:23S rRNA pseudouridine1911/1915/1917 synthase